jgi:polyribonucleotide nucleotidyltransferase
MDETQIICTVLAADGENEPDIPAFLGASAALSISGLPFLGPIAGVRVGRVDGTFLTNPTPEQRENSDFDLVVAGSRDALVMVEGGTDEASEGDVLSALQYAHDALVPQIDLQEELLKKCAPDPFQVPIQHVDQDLSSRIRGMAEERLSSAISITTKAERYAAIDEVESGVTQAIVDEYAKEEVSLESLDAIERRREGLRKLTHDTKETLHDLRSELMRERLLAEGARIDGRGPSDIRPIACEVRAVPRAHGAALFTRGETQALVYATLGSASDAQIIDSLTERVQKRFMLHYNFPPFSVGEARFLRGASRREIGHGHLAERAIAGVLPEEDDFPYTVRVVSEILESNGSSSMASVCGATLSLLDAGVQIKAPVAGIAMGLVQEGDRYVVLSDILGDEDHLGDMDFKVAGTAAGITALQMDIKIKSVDWKVMEEALSQAREGRLHILECMENETSQDLGGRMGPREDLSEWAPRLEVLRVKPDRIRDVIGPGGRVIRGIQDITGAKVDIDDSGEVTIFSPDRAALEKAQAMIEELTQEAEIDKLYWGKVKRVTDFGAFVEIFPGTDGLIHISHLADGRVDKVTDVVNEGDEVLAKCIDIDPSGRIRLSRKEALEDASTDG